jgi:hypothetical protein
MEALIIELVGAGDLAVRVDDPVLRDTRRSYSLTAL